MNYLSCDSTLRSKLDTKFCIQTLNAMLTCSSLISIFFKLVNVFQILVYFYKSETLLSIASISMQIELEFWNPNLQLLMRNSILLSVHFYYSLFIIFWVRRVG